MALSNILENVDHDDPLQVKAARLIEQLQAIGRKSADVANRPTHCGADRMQKDRELADLESERDAILGELQELSAAARRGN